MQEAEKAAQAKQDRADARAAAAEEAKEAAANAALAAEGGNIVNSPSNFSCHSYELFVGQPKGHDDNNKEKMSIRSEGLDSVSERRRIPNNLNKMRKVSAVSVLIFIEPLGNDLPSHQVTFISLIHRKIILPARYPVWLRLNEKLSIQLFHFLSIFTFHHF